MTSLNPNQFGDDADDGYDDVLPKPTRKGFVEFNGRPYPALAFHSNEASKGFVAPLENGGIANVQYFPKQRLTNVSMHHHRPSDRIAAATMLGAYDIESGRHRPAPLDPEPLVPSPTADADIDRYNLGKFMKPLDPDQTVEHLANLSRVELPERVVEDHREAIKRLPHQWSWRT